MGRDVVVGMMPRCGRSAAASAVDFPIDGLHREPSCAASAARKKLGERDVVGALRLPMPANCIRFVADRAALDVALFHSSSSAAPTAAGVARSTATAA